MEIPSTLLICRLALGLGHRPFAKIIGEDSRWLRDKESNTLGISLKKL